MNEFMNVKQVAEYLDLNEKKVYQLANEARISSILECSADAIFICDQQARLAYVNQQATWESRPIAVGTPLAKPTPIFTKLDPKLAETGPEWAPIA